MDDDADFYTLGQDAEKRSDTVGAIEYYKRVLRAQPSHMMARYRLGQLRFDPQAQPFLAAVRERAPIDMTEVVVEIRNPCNYRCFYCVAHNQNNTPVQQFDLEAVDRALARPKAESVVISLECGGGEPTVHPQFAELAAILTRYGVLSFPSNNSQDPKRWLPKANPERIFMRSTLHPESEAHLDKYIANARYILDHGVGFQGSFIAHPTRMDKVDYYKELFSSNDISFSVNAFIGEYDGKHYPHAYSDDEKRMLGLDRPSRYWLHRIEPQLNRIRNFRSIPCVAGFRSLYITKEGKLHRCLYDRKRLLETPLTQAEPCGVRECGCGMLLKQLTTTEDLSGYNFWAFRAGERRIDTDWLDLCARGLGYADASDALCREHSAMYDALMLAYGKDEFPEI